MKTSGACILLCFLALFLSPAEWFPWMVNGQELESATGEISTDPLISTSGIKKKLFTKDILWDPQQHPISCRTPSIFARKACRYSDKSDDNNITISVVYEPYVGWLLVRSAAAVTPPVLLSPVQSDSETTTASSDCREEKFPCTRLYSVHKPVKQCISYLCVTSVRRMYIINKEVCSRLVCKENEVMQDEICRQLAGLPSRRLRRSGQPLHLPCRELLEQHRRRPDAL